MSKQESEAAKNIESQRILIEQCQKGDISAFEKLYRLYCRDVYTMAMRMVRSPHIAEEVTQEVFISVFQNIHRFGFQSAFTTWLYRIVVRRCADYFRKNKRHQENTVSLIDAGVDENTPLDVKDTKPNPLDTAIFSQKQEILEEAIQALSYKQRMIVVLRYVNQLSYEEIAQVLKCRIGTVKSRLNRAHKMLEEILKDQTW